MAIKPALFLLTPVLILANPLLASAETDPVKLGLSGHAKIYGNYAKQNGGSTSRKTDLLRDIDLTMSGETTLSNGLTVGAAITADGDAGDSFEIEDSFIFTSGNWGRLSAGTEDGSAFMLQVAVPSADENVDGIEPFVQPLGFDNTNLAGTDFEDTVTGSFLTYGNYLTAGTDKVTYVTPVMNGLQAGISYTPDVMNFNHSSRSGANTTGNVLNEYGSAWEGALRYENKVSETTNYRVGAGYTTIAVERTNGASTVDTLKEWNVGFDMDMGNVGIGTAYTENNGGVVAKDNDSKTYVIGADYTMGSVRYGASWLHNTHEDSATEKVTANRYAVGAVHEYGPGMSLRASVSRLTADAPNSIGGDVNGTAVTVGTEILF